VAGDEIKAVEIDVADLDPAADVMVEQGQLDAQIAQQLLDRNRQPPALARRTPLAW
jgi:hypothetical protein